ncbi:MAG: hypothetical protein QXW10_02070 [Candidatus Micrarchaeaceae archaeon]
MTIDNIHMDSVLSVYFMGAAFLYLVVGTLLFVGSVSGLLKVGLGSVFMIWFFGFVMMMIFGLSYMFVPGLSHAKYADYRIIESEFVVLNVGMVSFFAGELARLNAVVIIGAVLILIGILIHTYDMAQMFSKRGKVSHVTQAH